MLEQMYNDFVTKVLPTIQEGLVISKDYFFDLFGRYVKYLIVVDSIWIVFGLIVTILGCIFVYNVISSKSMDSETAFGVFVLGGFLFIIGIFIFLINTFSLIKTIYIPEVRIYEEIQYLK